jgi:hypothetical protein
MWYWAKQTNARKLVGAKNEKDSVNRENFAGLVRPPQPARGEQPILDARSQSVAAANS